MQENFKPQIQIRLKSDFKSVFLLNGTFVENADKFSYPKGEPLYITTLPLSAHLLPYTIKIVSNRAVENNSLCRVFLHEEILYVKLLPRNAYIYSSNSNQNISHHITIPERMFHALKSKNLFQAKKYLSQNLLSTIDDESLSEFFKDYTTIVKDEFNIGLDPHIKGDRFYLIDDNGKGTPHNFFMYDNLIENITG